MPLPSGVGYGLTFPGYGESPYGDPTTNPPTTDITAVQTLPAPVFRAIQPIEEHE